MELNHIVSEHEKEQAEAIRFEDFLFVRTQFGWGKDGEIVDPGVFSKQFDLAFENLAAVLAQAGGSLSDVVRMRYPFVDGRNYIDCRRARHRVWPEHGPPATVVIAYGLPDTRALGGVEAIAYLGTDRDTLEWTDEFAKKDNTPDYSPEIRGKVGFSPAIRAGSLAFLAGQVALDDHDDYVALGDPEAQTRYAHENNIRVLSQLGLTEAAAVKLFNFLTYLHYADEVANVTSEYFPHRPVSSTIMASLGWPGNIIESEITAVVDVEPIYLPPSIFIADGAGHAAVKAGRLLFTGGIVGRSASGELVGPGDGRAQMAQIFSNLLELLEQAGTDPSHILMLNVYLAANTLFEAWEEAKTAFRKEHLDGSPFPPHSTYAVPSLGSYEHLAQIEAVAGLPDR